MTSGTASLRGRWRSARPCRRSAVVPPRPDLACRHQQDFPRGSAPRAVPRPALRVNVHRSWGALSRRANPLCTEPWFSARAPPDALEWAAKCRCRALRHRIEKGRARAGTRQRPEPGDRAPTMTISLVATVPPHPDGRTDYRASNPCCRTRKWARRLSLHRDKTRLVEFGRFAVMNRRQRGVGKPETFDFLGFTHYCTTTRRGRFRLGRKPVAKRVNRALARIDEVLRKRWHHDIWEVGKWLGRVCAGGAQQCAFLPQLLGVPAMGIPTAINGVGGAGRRVATVKAVATRAEKPLVQRPRPDLLQSAPVEGGFAAFAETRASRLMTQPGSVRPRCCGSNAFADLRLMRPGIRLRISVDPAGEEDHGTPD